MTLRILLVNFRKKMSKTLKITVILTSLLLLLNECGIYKPVDSRKVPVQGKERALKNLKEGRGISLKDIGKGGKTSYEFSSSNPMWRATLDILDFLPLTTVDYSGGVIISDWYSDQTSQNESIKISVRFLTNEVRSDALDIKVFYKKCTSIENCKIYQQDGVLVAELTKKILSKAAVYKKEKEKKDFKPYIMSKSKD